LSALFLLVYGGTNWVTSLRADVGTWYFPWELAIPFVPLLIIPYMSIDLFFVAAPFLCRDRREMTVLARRITFSILVAGVFFLLMPLRLAFAPEEPVGGVLGVVFDTFRGMDRPYNLFPSLHITLRTILAVTYARHTRGLVKIACQVWFSLIGFSTVLTHQHHLVDVAGGFVLAGFAFYLFRESAPRLPVTRNFRIAGYYAAGAAAVLAAAVALRPWGALLLWPAGALAVVTAAYLGLGPGIYRKTAGRLPPSTRFVLAPVLLGQHLSLWYYRRRGRAWDEVAPGVLIGRQLSDAEAAAALRQGVTAVLDLTAEFSEAAPFLTARYRHLPVLDLTAPTPDQLHDAVAFIAEQAATGTVYVHCKAGYSRSAAAVGAYLLASGQADRVEEAVALLRRARPSIIIRDEVMQALSAFAFHTGSAQLVTGSRTPRPPGVIADCWATATRR
jgi:protein-tyrosine phosphatase/membrane-associated phospholipid phosphatase